MNSNKINNQKTAKEKIFLFLKIVIGAGLLAYLVFRLNAASLSEIIRQSDKLLFAVVLLIMPLNIIVQYLKWKIVCEGLLDYREKKNIFRSLMIGIGSGLVTPLQAGEYVMRAEPLKNQPVFKVAAATFIDKLFPLFFVILSGAAAFGVYLVYYQNVSVFLAAFIYFLIFALILFVFFLLKKSKDTAKGIVRKVLNLKRLQNLKEKLAFLQNARKPFIFKLSFVSVLFVLIYIVQFVILLSAFTHEFELGKYFLFAFLLMFGKTVVPPFTFGEIGIRESIAVFIAGLLGVSESAGFNAAFFLFLVNVVLPSVVSLFFLFGRNE
ncbi:MAG: flippase-like domain-containing protein [Chlorobi bacterium]|nr:flippase-like domain-containing protein [Chlorobiota bacterium]